MCMYVCLYVYMYIYICEYRPRVNPSTTTMQMLPLLAGTSVTHRGPQCLLTLARSLKPPLRSIPCACVLVCSLYMNRL